MKIGIVILNWNGIKDSLNCLDSIYRNTREKFCVVFVDNGSVDNSIESVEEWSISRDLKYCLLDHDSKIQLIADDLKFEDKLILILKLSQNLGYGAGNNVAIRYLDNFEVDYILILNNDMKLLPGALSKMVAAFGKDKSIGVVGCDLIDMISGKQLANGNRSYWLGVHFLWKIRRKQNGIIGTNFAPGCAILVRSEVFPKIGGFIEEYFLYTDDIEFCHRVIENGLKIKINLDAKVLAKVSASSGGERNPLYYYFITRNTLYFITAKLSGLQRVIAFICFAIARVVQMVQWAILLKKENIKAVINGFNDFNSGIKGMGHAKKYIEALELKAINK